MVLAFLFKFLTRLLENTTCKTIVNIAKLFNALNLLFLINLCIVTSLMFLSIDLAAQPIIILTSATYSSMITTTITSSRENTLVTTKAMENNMDLACKTKLINPLSSVPIDSVNYLTMITNNTNRDFVTTLTAAKESNLIDSVLFYPYKAESTIITYDLTAETLHKSQTVSSILSNSCLTTDGREEVINDLMVNNSKTSEMIDSDDLCDDAINTCYDFADAQAARIEYAIGIESITADRESDGDQISVKQHTNTSLSLQSPSDSYSSIDGI